VAPPFWPAFSGTPGPVGAAGVGDADGSDGREGLGAALVADGDGEGDPLALADGDGDGAAEADAVAGAVLLGDAEAALLDGASGTLARRSSGRAVSREGLS
jgi:hypothetical protein